MYCPLNTLPQSEKRYNGILYDKNKAGRLFRPAFTCIANNIYCGSLLML